MDGALSISVQGLKLIAGFEGFRARSARLPDGSWVIGHGHTRTARAGLRISREDARLLLRYHDLPPVEAMLREHVLIPLTQNEFDALVSFAWNIGIDAFRASPVLSAINAGDRPEAAARMWRWRYGLAEGEHRLIDALARRRAAEISLFLTYPAGPVPVPGAFIRPVTDMADHKRPSGRAGQVTIAAHEPWPPDINRRLPVGEGVPEAAIRSVGDRMTRILGERDAGHEPVPGEDGPSIEEITRAIADLAAPPGKGPPNGVERRRLPRVPMEGQPLPEGQDAGIVDDLAPVVIDQGRVAALMEPGREERRRELIRDVSGSLPFAILSGLGLVGLFLGIRRLTASGAQGFAEPAAVWIGPLLALGGGLVFVMATYYLYLVLRGEE